MASTQNTLIMIGDTTISTNIKPAYIAELMQCSKVTGKSLSRLLNEAVNDFMMIKAPVYMNSADPTTWDWTKRPTERKRRPAKIRPATTTSAARPAPATNTETPFADSAKQFAADVWAKVLASDPFVAGQPFEDEEGDDILPLESWGNWLIVMYKDYERSQQPQVDAAIQYLDPSASA